MLVDDDIFYSYFFRQKKGDCDYFVWTDHEMTTYEMKIMERVKVIEDRRHADRG
jgi:hypothetical protein